MNLNSHYVAFVDLREIGIGLACDPSSFDDAVDAYAEKRGEGYDACVMRYDAPVGGACGIMSDVTADANETIRRRLRARGEYFMPKWLVEEMEAKL